MTPLSLPVSASMPAQPVRAAAALPAAPAPVPLAAPAMVARVEWAGAVRPPDALLRAFRPDHEPRANPDLPTGPPPAFAANLLDLLPESIQQGQEAARTPSPEADGPTSPASAEAAPDRAAMEQADIRDALPAPLGVPTAPLAPAGSAASAVLAALGERADRLQAAGDGGMSPGRAEPAAGPFLDVDEAGWTAETTSVAETHRGPAMAVARLTQWNALPETLARL